MNLLKSDHVLKHKRSSTYSIALISQSNLCLGCDNDELTCLQDNFHFCGEPSNVRQGYQSFGDFNGGVRPKLLLNGKPEHNQAAPECCSHKQQHLQCFAAVTVQSNCGTLLALAQNYIHSYRLTHEFKHLVCRSTSIFCGQSKAFVLGQQPSIKNLRWGLM